MSRLAFDEAGCDAGEVAQFWMCLGFSTELVDELTDLNLCWSGGGGCWSRQSTKGQLTWWREYQ
eukprot:8647479-Lingulodinium_polyedra.AAC.1